MAGDQLQLGDDPGMVRLRRAWEDALRVLAGQVNKLTFESYIRPIKPVSFVDQVITLGVASGFAREWLKRYLPTIRTVLEEHYTGPLEIRFTVVPTGDRPKLEANEAVAVEAAPAPKRGRPVASDIIHSLPLNEDYNFDNFVIGKSNRLAHAASMSVAATPGQPYNPLFIYGNSGLGKTHLLHAVGNACRQINPKLRVALVDGEKFTQNYVNCLRDRKLDDFRRHFRTVDVWLVDDIQFIAGREQTKEEFFHTFNTLYQSGKQIVITSDRPPRELRAMDERLRSRFQAGLAADINPPELEVRMAILQLRCRSEMWDVPAEVINYIAESIQSNVRALQGALTRLVAYASVMNSPQTIELAQEILGDFFIDRPPHGSRMKGIAIETLQIAVSDHFGVTPEMLAGQRRDKQVASARQMAMYLCRELTQYSLSQIGSAFGGRDHTTAQRAIAKVEAQLTSDIEMQKAVSTIRSKVER